MQWYEVKVLKIEDLTHNVKRFVLEKPKDFIYNPAQAISIKYGEHTRTFTLTSIPEDEILEMTIKIYQEHKGMTLMMESLHPGDSINISDAFGRFTYRGKGVYIACGVGVTPFLSFGRSMYKKERSALVLTNRTHEDIILEQELQVLFNPLLLTLTREEKPGYHSGRIDEAMLAQFSIDQYFYICGTMEFAQSIKKKLFAMGVEQKNISITAFG